MPRHALIVDPNSERFGVYRDILRDEGMPVEWAQNGLRACEYLHAHGDVGLVVTELSLPGTDGFQVLRALSRTRNAGVPVLVASAFPAMRKTAFEQRDELGIGYVLSTTTAPLMCRHVIRRLLRHEALTAETPSWTTSRAGEARRLRSLERTGASRAHPKTDGALRSIVEQVASELAVPVAAVSLVLEEKQWFKARVGTQIEETSLEQSFCRHVVEARESLIVPDATIHPTFAGNPLVRENSVRGYAGAPIIGSDGEVWGALCVMDPDKPLALTTADVEKLLGLARLVSAQIEAHLSTSLLPSGGPGPTSAILQREVVEPLPLPT
jgi:CheY-like chemotaxis protein